MRRCREKRATDWEQPPFFGRETEQQQTEKVKKITFFLFPDSDNEITKAPAAKKDF
jgi:hypothetical protein